MPWARLDCGVSNDFLLEEVKKSHEEILTGDCRDGCCTECGVCDFSEIRMRLHQPVVLDPSDKSGDRQLNVVETEKPAALQETGASGEGAEVARIRLRFSKTGAMSLLSHLELLHLFTRAVRRAGIPIRYSLGFHPHPKFSFATALSVGVESWAEYFDMEISAGLDAQSVRDSLNASLPEGLRILEAAEIPLRSESLSVLIEAVRYRVFLPAGFVPHLPEKAEDFLRLETFMHRRVKKGKTFEIDLRQELSELYATDDMLEMVVKRGKPLEFASAITGIPEDELRPSRIEKREVCFREVS